jgi:hypothetical protein
MMRSGRWVMAGLSLVLIACGGSGDAADSTTADSAAATADNAAPASATASLMAVDNSGVTGDVTLTASGEQTTIGMHVNGGPANTTMEAHVHSGTCETSGPVVAPLDSVKTDATGMGMINTTVSIPFATVNNGQHFVQVHKPDGKPAACANVPAKM